MSFVDHIVNSVRMLSMNRKAIEEIKEEPKATGYGFAVFAIASLAMVFTWEPLEMLLRMALMLLFLAVGVMLFQLIGKHVLGDKISGAQYFRFFSNTCVIYWLTFIPLIGIPLQIFAGSWMMIINTLILHRVQGVSNFRALIMGGVIPFIFLTFSVALRILGILPFVIGKS